MATSLKQLQTQKQKLAPKQVLQAKLLQLNTINLKQAVLNELEQNPILEQIETNEEQQIVENEENSDDEIDAPLEDMYSYESLYYLSEENFVIPEPYYPQALQCFYYPLKMQLWAQIPMPEMHNLYHAFLNYWSQQTSKTAVRFIFYIWEPGSKNKPENYNRTSDMEDWNLDLHDPSNNIYMYYFTS